MFEAVFGHQRPKRILKRMVATNRLHHGLCFHGPNGIGKRLMAQECAKAMLCEHLTGCGQCQHCRKLASGNHPDYTEIYPEGLAIKVGQIRELTDNLHFKPFEARARMIVLDQAERLREQAANAFLKSLEEPPDYVYFILVTADIKALLPTIRSRCQKISFQSLAENDKTQILEKRFGLETTLAKRLASISFRQLETEEAAWDLFVKDVRASLAYVEMMLEQGHAIDYLSEWVRDKLTRTRFLDHFLATARALTLTAHGLSTPYPFDAFQKDLKALAVRRKPPVWREIWEQVTRLRARQHLNPNYGLWFNATSLEGLDLLDDAARHIKERLGRTGK